MRESAAMATVATLPRKPKWTPQHRLYWAILKQAIVDTRSPHWFGDDARMWIASGSAERHSFEWCCTVLGLNPSAVRRAVILQRSRCLHHRCGLTNSMSRA